MLINISNIHNYMFICGFQVCRFRTRSYTCSGTKTCVMFRCLSYATVSTAVGTTAS